MSRVMSYHRSVRAHSQEMHRGDIGFARIVCLYERAGEIEGHERKPDEMMVMMSASGSSLLKNER